MAEPILWAHRAQQTRTQLARRWNPTSQTMEVVVDDETGQPVRERVPQRAHDPAGGYDAPRLARMSRWLHVCTQQGNTVRVPISMAAADAEGTDHYGKMVRAKAQHLGWLPVGQCPLRLLAAGAVQRHQLVDPALREAASKNAAPCSGQHGEERPCPHYLAEETARKAAQARRQAKVDAAYKTDADKVIASNQQQTRDIVSGVAGALADALRAAQPEAPAPTPRSRG